MFDKKEIDDIIYQHFDITESMPSDQLFASDSYVLRQVDALKGKVFGNPAIDNIYYCVKADMHLRIFEVLVDGNKKYIFHMSWDDNEFKVFTLSRWVWSQEGYINKGLDPKLYWDMDHQYSWDHKYTSIYDFETKLKEILDK